MMGLKKDIGSQPGSTRSTITLPWRGPNTPGATSTTPEKSVGLQTAPTPFGLCHIYIPRCSVPQNAPVKGWRFGNRKERRSITTDVEAVVEWLTGLHGLEFETPFWKFCHMVSFYADALPPNQRKAM